MTDYGQTWMSLTVTTDERIVRAHELFSTLVDSQIF